MAYGDRGGDTMTCQPVGEIKDGDAVTLCGNYKVKRCMCGDPVFGQAMEDADHSVAEQPKITIKISGIVTFPVADYQIVNESKVNGRSGIIGGDNGKIDVCAGDYNKKGVVVFYRDVTPPGLGRDLHCYGDQSVDVLL